MTIKAASATWIRIVSVSLGVASIIAALVTLITYQSRMLISVGVSQLLSIEDGSGEVVQAGLRAGIAMSILVGAVFGIPALWRSHSHPRTLRMLALAGVQTPAICVGLLIPDIRIATVAVIVLSLWGALWWAIWAARWQGTGVAPSLLTGVLKPRIHPGQIWFAFITGHQVSKVRPVVVIEPAHAGEWKVLYFTSQEPKTHLQKKYLAVNEGSLRGLSGQNFIEVVDIRHLKPKHFKKYVGLAPRWVYDSATRQAGLTGTLDALVVDEIRAGEHMGPFERAAFDTMFATGSISHATENSFLTDGLRRFLRMTIKDKN